MPILNGKKVNGRPRKRAFGAAWLRPILKLLASAKLLRGTVLDPFGYMPERRMERRLIAEYEALVASVLNRLSVDNHAASTKLLGLADMIRGFGPVKQDAVEKYKAELARLESANASEPIGHASPPRRIARPRRPAISKEGHFTQ